MKHRVTRAFVAATLAFATLSLAAPPALAQEEPAAVAVETESAYPANALMINPLSLVFGAAAGIWSIRLDFERRVLPWMGITAQPSFMYWSFESVDIVGGGLQVGLPMFPGQTSLRGFFVKPVVGLEYADGSVEDASGGLGVLGIGATIGYTWQWEYGLIMSLEAGAAYPVLFGDLADEVEDDLSLKVLPMLNYWIGWSF